MKVSIITTVYQAEDNLHRLLDSMVAQQCRDLEFLLIDNGSTDGSAAICAEYASRDSRIKILTLDKNIGYIAARNLGLDTVDADYVGFCDSDDYLEPEGYDKAVEVIKTTNCDIYITGWKVRTGELCHTMLPPFDYGLYNNASIASDIMPQFFGSLPNRPMMQAFMWKQLIKTSLVAKTKARFIETFKPCEDIVFNAELVSLAESVFIDKTVIYNYITSENSITGKMVRQYDLSVEYQRTKKLRERLLTITDDPLCRLANANQSLYGIVTMISRLEQTFGSKQGRKLFAGTVDPDFIKEICRASSPQPVSMKVFSRLLSHGCYGLLFTLSRWINAIRNRLNNKQLPPPESAQRPLPSYSVAIRTLGTAGEKYLRLLKSLDIQTHKPRQVVVYLAEGYPLPKETIGKERIVYVKKGMVAQRALHYEEIDTDWILFLDDDVELAPDCMERMFGIQEQNAADVVAFDSFPRSEVAFRAKLMMMLCLTAIPHFAKNKGYRVNCLGTFNYNARRKKTTAWSTTNAGPGFLCRKADFLKIKFDDDLWLDKNGYAWPEDAVMFYKMHRVGLRMLTWYAPPFRHLDAQASSKDDRHSGGDRALRMSYLAAYNTGVFYYKYVYPDLPLHKRAAGRLLRGLSSFNCGICTLVRSRRGRRLLAARRQGIKDAKLFCRNEI